MQLDMSVEEAKAGQRRWMKRMFWGDGVICMLMLASAFLLPTIGALWALGVLCLLGVTFVLMCASAALWHREAMFYARGHRDGKTAR